VQAFIAAPGAEGPKDTLSSALRIEYYSYREELAGPNGPGRLGQLLRGRIDQDAKTLGLAATTVSAQEVSISGRPGFAIQYTLRGGGREASGTLIGTLLDGTVVILDLRIGAEDATALSAAANDIVGSIRITPGEQMTVRSFGPYTVSVPAAWEVADAENQGGGRNVFARAPSGVDVRFQTAVQKRHDTIDTEVLRRVATGFLVEGLKVLTLKDMASARRLLAPGGGPGLRFETTSGGMNVLVFAYMQGEHMVFALRGAPATYRGRDLAVAAQMMRSFTASGAARPFRPDPPRVAGDSVSKRTAFSRTDLDAVAPDGSIRPASGLFVALLPDGSAGIVTSRNGRTEDIRGRYRIEGDQITIEGQGIGRVAYRMSEDGETLQGELGEVLFRAREAETP
jgi:hypothetical protein